MRHHLIVALYAVASTLQDVANQAESHAANLAGQLGPDVSVDVNASTVTMPISKLRELLQPEDVLLPVPEPGTAWQVQPVGAPAPAGAIAAFAFSDELHTVPRPTGPSILYLVPTVGGV